MRLHTLNREILLFKIDNVPDCKTYNAMCFGHQLEHAFKIRQFCETAKSVWLSQKQQHYKTAIAEAKKLYNVQQYFCRFQADKKRCFDDTFQFFYTSSEVE